MGVIYGLENLGNEPKGRAVAIGVFDGVHWGHKAIFAKLVEVASQSNLEPIAMTFEKHPTEMLAPTRAPYYINTLSQRVELIQATGVKDVVVADFSPGFANLTHEEFVSRVLQKLLSARHIVVGSNFRFGKDRMGDIRYLMETAPHTGISVTVVPAVIINDGPVSSTRIRALISRGDIAGASKLLGRRFALRGTVVMGRQVGRTIGFPTANIRTEPRQLIPARGVYAVEVQHGRSTFIGVCNIGTRPTFDIGIESIEVHLTGFKGNIYGEQLDVVFCRRLRDEMKFESPESLADQIRRDLERVTDTTGSGHSD